MRRSVLIISLLLGFALSGLSQNLSYSQFYMNKMYINPSYAGLDNALNLSVHHRNQWLGVGEGNQFNASSISMDYGLAPQRKGPGAGLGFGLMYNRSEAGISNYRTNELSFTLASDAPRIGDEKRGFMAQFPFGVQVGFVNQKYDWSELIFSDQIDPVLGYVIPNNSSPADFNVTPDNTFMDIGFGGMAGIKFGDRRHPNFVSAGAAYHKYIRINDDYVGDYNMPSRITAHILYQKPINESTAIAPGVMYEKQGDLETLIIGSQVHFMKNFIAGMWFRNKNLSMKNYNYADLVLSFGWQYNNLTVGYSYDVTVSDLSHQNTTGTHEIAINFRLYDDKQRILNQRRSNTHCFFNNLQ